MGKPETESRRHFLRFLAASPLLAAWLPALAQQRVASEVLKASDALNVFELESIARRNIPPAHFGYLSGGVLDDRTITSNRQAFDAWGLRARRLIDVSNVDLSIRLFGKPLASPVILSPVSSQRAFHPHGEAAAARAAGKRKALQILSGLTTVSLEDVMAAHGGEVWQQIYTSNRPEAGLKIAARADAAGAGALVLTVDLAGGMRRETKVIGARADTRDCGACHRQGPGYDFSRKKMFDGIDLAGIFAGQSDSLTWDYVARLRDVSKKRLLVKGIMTAEDAAIAVRRGVDGIIVSNHGGRAEESLVGTLDVLPEIVAAVKGKIPILIDGGFRRGTDVFKALALGATAVCIGRPYCWGLGAFGEEGVNAALRLIDEELASTMRQTGITSIAGITKTSLSKRN
ncbi:alpha-hydroxy acid oxidase [Sandarakinorhabdus rubra]|uniref:alpha-hydroxy acid oxidase n=1 Tax=Sandarakinorhabdus rubra TaxID=2672568 RepID=UPI0013DBAAD6|nr:alpha-hydroxy acid oxidase [Sandarakinorhabdus rubra]